MDGSPSPRPRPCTMPRVTLAMPAGKGAWGQAVRGAGKLSSSPSNNSALSDIGHACSQKTGWNKGHGVDKFQEVIVPFLSPATATLSQRPPPHTSPRVPATALCDRSACTALRRPPPTFPVTSLPPASHLPRHNPPSINPAASRCAASAWFLSLASSASSASASGSSSSSSSASIGS